MSSEVCIPLQSLVLARAVFVLGGTCSLVRSHKITHVVWPPPLLGERGPRRFGRKLDSEDGGEHPGEAHSETHLRVGNDRGYPRSYPTGSLTLARGSNKDYRKQEFPIPL